MNSLGVATSMCAELGAIRSGLELAWSRGFTKLLVESDSLSTISILKRTEPANSKWVRHHIDAIWDLLRKPWCVRFVHVYREANKCADWLANYAITMPVGMHVLDAAPLGRSSLLLADIIGLCIDY